MKKRRFFSAKMKKLLLLILLFKINQMKFSPENLWDKTMNNKFIYLMYYFSQKIRNKGLRGIIYCISKNVEGVK